jgi:hypothetical protein
MSVRAIAIRNGPRPAAAVLPTGTRRRPVMRTRFRASLADDRRLIGVKLILIGLLFLAMMALEVPL